MNDLPRTQHIFASGLVAMVGASVAFISYTQEPAAAFLFPRMISTVFATLALITFAKALTGRTKVGNGLSSEALRNIAPGLAVALVYVFWAAEFFGFYIGSTIAFFVLLALYDPAPHGEIKSWLKRVAISLGFLAIMYSLFNTLLSVFTPRGMFF